MSSDKQRVQPAVLKVKPKPSYPDVLAMQLRLIMLTVNAFQKHVKSPRSTDDQWVALANKHAANIAGLHSLALETTPPAEHQSLHRRYVECTRSFHEATSVLFDAANSNQPGNSDDYRRARELVVRGWRWWAVVSKQCSRARTRQAALHGLEDAQLVA